MKKFFIITLIMAIIAHSANAQYLEISSTKIDSIISITSNSCTFSVHIVGLNKGGWIMATFASEPNKCGDLSDMILVHPTKDTIMIIKMNDLLPSKRYYIGINIFFNSYSSWWSGMLTEITTSPVKKD